MPLPLVGGSAPSLLGVFILRYDMYMSDSRIRTATKYVVVHHSVTPQEWGMKQTMELIKSAHKNAGLAYDGFPAYHYIIGNDWACEGRPENTVGYHAGVWSINLESVAVCLVGNFNENKLTSYQKSELQRILKKWTGQYDIELDHVKLHRELKATACPGNNITKDLIYQLLKDTVMEDQLKRKIEELTAQVKRLHAEVRKLTAEVHKWQGEAKTRQDAVVVRDAEIAELNGVVDRKEKVIVQLQKEIDELRTTPVGDLDEVELRGFLNWLRRIWRA